MDNIITLTFEGDIIYTTKELAAQYSLVEHDEIPNLRVYLVLINF